MADDIPTQAQIVRLTTTVEILVAEVRHLTAKVDNLKDDRVVDVEMKLGLLEERLANEGQRLKKIEDSCTWLVRTVVAEGIALVGGIILWAINSFI